MIIPFPVTNSTVWVSGEQKEGNLLPGPNPGDVVAVAESRTTFIAARVPWPHSSTSQLEVKYWMLNLGTAVAPGSDSIGVKKTSMGWLKPLTNFRRSSWVRVLLDGSRKITVAGLPPNGSWVNALAIANGYDLGVWDADDMEGGAGKCVVVVVI